MAKTAGTTMVVDVEVGPGLPAELYEVLRRRFGARDGDRLVRLPSGAVKLVCHARPDDLAEIAPHLCDAIASGAIPTEPANGAGLRQYLRPPV